MKKLIVIFLLLSSPLRELTAKAYNNQVNWNSQDAAILKNNVANSMNNFKTNLANSETNLVLTKEQRTGEFNQYIKKGRHDASMGKKLKGKY